MIIIRRLRQWNKFLPKAVKLSSLEVLKAIDSQDRFGLDIIKTTCQSAGGGLDESQEVLSDSNDSTSPISKAIKPAYWDTALPRNDGITSEWAVMLFSFCSV